jgi:hypothetical protein
VLIVPKFAELPPWCVKCGKDSVPESRLRTFRWRPAWLFPLLFLGLIPYLLISYFATKQWKLKVPLCSDHLLKQRRAVRAGILTSVLGLALLVIVANSSDSHLLTVLCLISIVSGLILTFAAHSCWLWLRFMDDNHARFFGAKEAFLVRLPTE